MDDACRFALVLGERNGDRDRFGGSAELSLTGLGVAGEGPLPAGTGSYLLSMRLADLRFFRFINEDVGMPCYGDGLFKCSVDLGRSGALLLHAIGSFDTFRGPPGEPAEGYDIDNVAQHKSNAEAGPGKNRRERFRRQCSSR